MHPLWLIPVVLVSVVVAVAVTRWLSQPAPPAIEAACDPVAPEPPRPDVAPVIEAPREPPAPEPSHEPPAAMREVSVETPDEAYDWANGEAVGPVCDVCRRPMRTTLRQADGSRKCKRRSCASGKVAA